MTDPAGYAVGELAHDRQLENLAQGIDVAECRGLSGSPELQGLVGFKVDGGEGSVGFDM